MEEGRKGWEGGDDDLAIRVLTAPLIDEASTRAEEQFSYYSY
jgi:hypothetical protein